MIPRIDFTAEQESEIKRLYARTSTPVRDIAALMGVSRRTIENRARLWGLPPRKVASRPVELLHAIRGAVMADVTAGTLPEVPQLSADALARQRAAIALRILQAVEHEIDAVQRVLAVLDPSNKDEIDRTTRALAGLSRTLREAAVLNRPDGGAPRDDSEEDPVPGDIDEFRRELARRLRGLIHAERCGAEQGPGGDSPALD